MDISSLLTILNEAVHVKTHIGILILATWIGLFTEYVLVQKLARKYARRGYPPNAEESTHDLALKVGGYVGVFAACVSAYFGYNALVFPVFLYLLHRPLSYLWVQFSVRILQSSSAVTVAYVFMGVGTGALPTAIYYGVGLAVNLLIWQFFYG